MKTMRIALSGLACACLALAGCGGGGGGDGGPTAKPTAVGVAPGPELLQRAPPRAPQLENTGAWQAAPILVSGTSAYRKGEFLYQDYLFDDLGAGSYSYPTNDAAYKRNAADIVELRMKPLESELAIRLTLNTMTDPALVGASIALGTSATPRAFPHGANTSAPAQVFVTTWGTSGDVTNAANGQVIGRPTVTVDLERRQIDIRVPYAYFDPRGMRSVRVAAGVGLWNASANAYLVPRERSAPLSRAGPARPPRRRRSSTSRSAICSRRAASSAPEPRPPRCRPATSRPSRRTSTSSSS